MDTLNEDYWTERYQNNATGWDIGYVSTPIKEYIDQLADKDIKILIPGAGNSYEAEYLIKSGFNNVSICDFSIEPLQILKNRVPVIKDSQLIHSNYFNLKGAYDLILEQTFFCALDPSLRVKYAKQTHHLLSNKGKLAGLLFNKIFDKKGPPFGGTNDNYVKLFSPHFNIITLADAYNSIKERAGSESFIIMQKI